MEYRRLGRSGLQLSVLSFGSWVSFSKQINDKVADELMGVAYDNGINFFDNAEVYALGESEKMMGRVLKKKNGTALLTLFHQKLFGDGEEKQINPTKQAAAVNTCWKPATRLCKDYRLIILTCFFATAQTKTHPLKKRCGQ